MPSPFDSWALAAWPTHPDVPTSPPPPIDSLPQVAMDDAHGSSDHGTDKHSGDGAPMTAFPTPEVPFPRGTIPRGALCSPWYCDREYLLGGWADARVWRSAVG